MGHIYHPRNNRYLHFFFTFLLFSWSEDRRNPILAGFYQEQEAVRAKASKTRNKCESKNTPGKWLRTYPSLPSFVYHGKSSMTYNVLFGELVFTHLDYFHFNQFSFNHRHFERVIYLQSRTKINIIIWKLWISELDWALHYVHIELLITSNFPPIVLICFTNYLHFTDHSLRCTPNQNTTHNECNKMNRVILFCVWFYEVDGWVLQANKVFSTKSTTHFNISTIFY